MNTPDTFEFSSRSSLYQEYMAEREKILEHKWLESEKEGTDIGFERALFSWVRHHRNGWLRHRRSLRHSSHLVAH